MTTTWSVTITYLGKTIRGLTVTFEGHDAEAEANTFAEAHAVPHTLVTVWHVETPAPKGTPVRGWNNKGVETLIPR